MTLHRSRGSAVILAMVLAAFAAVVAVTVLADQQRWARTVEHRRDQVQAQALAMAGVQWAREILDDAVSHSPSIDHLGQPWALPLPPIPLENGEIRGSITDAQARLNVNALGVEGMGADATARRIARLFAALGGPATAVDAIADWIDTDGIPRAAGAEDTYYGAQPAPGLAANQPVTRIGELAYVKGVDAGRLAAVAPFLTALPANAPVNLNTAPPEVLSTLVEGASGESVAAIVAGRTQKPFTTIAEFRSRLPQGTTLRSDDALAVRSDYFYATIVARQGSTIATARALLHRSAGAWPEIVWQVVD
jgi:general secretion pathway protein K